MFIPNKNRMLRKGKSAKAEIALVLGVILTSALFFAAHRNAVRVLSSDFRDAPAAYEELQNVIAADQRPEIPVPAVSGQIHAVWPVDSILELKIATYHMRGPIRREGKPEPQLKESAAALSGAAPDIIVLQNVENARILEQFNSGYLNGGYLPFLTPGNDERGDVAFLVKKVLPFRIERRTHKNEMWRDPDGRDTPLFSRDLPALIARAQESDKPLFILFGTHYKSTRTVSAHDPGCSLLRAAQVERTIEIIKRYQREFWPGSPVLLAGDFNSELHHEKAFNALWRTAGLADSFDLLARPPPVSERTTRAFFPANGPAWSDQIDGVLVSSALYSSVRNAEVYRYKDARGSDRRPSAGHKEREQNQSEHYPVVVTLDFQSILNLWNDQAAGSVRTSAAQAAQQGSAPAADLLQTSVVSKAAPYDMAQGLSPWPPPAVSDRTGAGAGVPVETVIESRLKQPEIKKSILGALTYLDDTQIRRRAGRKPLEDSSDGKLSRQKIKINLPGPKNLSVAIRGVQNTEGGWANYINMGAPYPAKLRGKRLPVAVQDSNMFVTAFVTYPLYLVDDRDLPAGERSVSRMRRLATSDINQYQRGDGYNFWRPRGDALKKPTTITQTGLPSTMLSLLSTVMKSQPWKGLFSFLYNGVDATVRDWMGVVTDKAENPAGGKAFFNIPNDADDTAVAVANQTLFAAGYDPGSPDPYYRNPANFRVDLESLKKLEQFRDVERKKSSAHDAWKGANTGAFLTWLKDENLPSFGSPETGVLPGAVNLVDEVVNANAVFAMGLNGIRDTEGFNAACRVIADSAEKKHWQQAYLYYPQRMTFPYAASRAFRDGRADNEIMRGAMKKLMADVLDDQENFEKKNPKAKGAFPSGPDPSTDLSTAMGVIFLLNTGRNIAEESGLDQRYDRALKNGIDYLVKNRKTHSVKHTDTLALDASAAKQRGGKWKEGLFFAGDPQNLTQWVSEGFTTALVLEAMSKYALAYDQSGRSIRDAERLKLSRGADGTLNLQFSRPKRI